MADTGWKSPGTVSISGSTYDSHWENLDNAKVSNNTYCSVTYDDDLPTEEWFTWSESLLLTNFGFNIADPGGSYVVSILGVETRVECKASVGNSQVFWLYKLTGVTGSEDKGNGGTGPGWYLPTTDTYKVLGGPTDMWGTSISVSEVNSSSFGFLFEVDANAGETTWIDHCQMKVYYEIIGPQENPVVNFFGV